MYYIIFIIIVIIFTIYGLNKLLNDKIEHFCKIKKYNNFDAPNDKRVLLDYAPQENVMISSCQDYWKEDPVEANNNLIGQTTAMPLKSDEYVLPKEKQFGNNSYEAGLIDYKSLVSKINDEYDDKINDIVLQEFEEKNVNPLTKEKLEFSYNLRFEYDQLNKKTWINRWKKFNPNIKNVFSYDEIKSDIEDINILNKEFLDRINLKQTDVMTDSQLVLFGVRDYQIFKYKIVRIEYHGTEVLYIMTIVLYRPSNLYLSNFSYMGIIIDGKPKIYNGTYMGGNTSDNYLLSDFYDPKELKQEIINDNYSNKVKFENNASAIIKMEKDQEEGYKIHNQYGCFNILNTNDTEGYLLPYYNKETCEAMYDEYGRSKPVGIYDHPCKKNEECPFFKLNKNYPNDYGKCLPSGYCQLPSNMEPVGYHYFKPTKKPLCYNCSTKHNKFYDKFGEIDECCDQQNDKTKYPHLKSPDYAFDNDLVERQNYYAKHHCYTKYEDGKMICTNIK